jgi:hypothetical protein
MPTINRQKNNEAMKHYNTNADDGKLSITARPYETESINPLLEDFLPHQLPMLHDLNHRKSNTENSQWVGSVTECEVEQKRVGNASPISGNGTTTIGRDANGILSEDISSNANSAIGSTTTGDNNFSRIATQKNTNGDNNFGRIVSTQKNNVQENRGVTGISGNGITVNVYQYPKELAELFKLLINKIETK